MTNRDGNAIVYCPGAFGTPAGKCAHAVVRRCRRYHVVAVIDHRHAGADAGEVLDGKRKGIAVLPTIESAVACCTADGRPATHLVIGLMPNGGECTPEVRGDILTALGLGLHVDSGLHDYLSDDPECVAVAQHTGVTIRDIRRIPQSNQLHRFSGKIREVQCLRIAVLGTDSAVGKRTTAWALIDALETMGYRPQFVGTSYIAWLQGARYGVILDSLVNDLIPGELEHAVWSAWRDRRPDVMVIEGRGSLLNPAHPGGLAILGACDPDIVVLQHAPMRRDYDGLGGYAIQPLARQIQAIEALSDKPVVAITINHEGIAPHDRLKTCRQITRQTGLPACDVLLDGGVELCGILGPYIDARTRATVSHATPG